MSFDFIKAEGAGNDFIIIDAVSLPPAANIKELAERFCERNKSIGADGLLVYGESTNCDFKMSIYNPDGNEVEMCGNGARCLALYAYQKKAKENRMMIETKAGRVGVEIKDETVKLKLTEPKDARLNFDLAVGGENLKISFINTGVPHIVCFVDDVSKIDVKTIGRGARFHDEFKPQGTNANFVEILEPGKLKIRTYERGVEEETLACGTGSAAAGVIAGLLKKVTSPVEIETASGEVLKIYFDIETGTCKNVYLEGKCSLVYEGKIGI
ncbi:MAG: diaminopimelate epimerase [Candidatus Omnitrophica bacterium]|nr:diaminopimelate epimerase [Candidatus Omnitrophota bacterium]